MNNTTVTLSPLAQMRELVVLMRPRQWVKNGFVLAPLVFTGKFLNLGAVGSALLATLLFCIASSATYILNDIKDIEYDRRHPEKLKNRPLASGMVTVPMAVSLLVALYGCLVWGWFVVPNVILVICGYLLLNVAYTFILKNQPVIDIFTIAIGFVLRIYAGAEALSVPISSWMFVTTLCLTLYLISIKRRQELIQSGSESRRVLEKYSLSLIERYAEMSGTGALVFYSLVVMSTRPQLVISIPLVLFGLFRYWFVVEEQGGGESPTDALLMDWQLLLTVIVWIGVCAWALWPTKG